MLATTVGDEWQKEAIVVKLVSMDVPEYDHVLVNKDNTTDCCHKLNHSAQLEVIQVLTKVSSMRVIPEHIKCRR